jgi:hypothetical protein
LKDEDGETALFVVETVDAARVLVEELGLDADIENDEGMTAQQKIEAEGDWPTVAAYLANLQTSNGAGTESSGTGHSAAAFTELPPLPEGVEITVDTMEEPSEAAGEPEPELRRRIQELAASEDFHTAEGQAALRKLIEDVLAGEDLGGERSVRSRQI